MASDVGFCRQHWTYMSSHNVLPINPYGLSYSQTLLILTMFTWLVYIRICISSCCRIHYVIGIAEKKIHNMKISNQYVYEKRAHINRKKICTQFPYGLGIRYIRVCFLSEWNDDAVDLEVAKHFYTFNMVYR